MRHSDVRVTTGTYSHLLVEDLRAAVDAHAPKPSVPPPAEPPLAAFLLHEAGSEANDPAKGPGNLRKLEAESGGRCRIRTCDPCRVKSANIFSNTCAGSASSGNHDGRTSTDDCTDYQDLARFGGRLAAFLLHEPARLLTVREVAALLAVSTPIVYSLCERGELEHTRISNSIRIAPSALVTYLRRDPAQ